MSSPTLNAIDCPCACGAKARVTAGGSGALTIYCGSCKFQGFAKSPRAVDALKKRIGAPAADRPAGRPADKPAEDDDDGNWLKKL